MSTAWVVAPGRIRTTFATAEGPLTEIGTRAP